MNNGEALLLFETAEELFQKEPEVLELITKGRIALLNDCIIFVLKEG